ncbi:MAG: phytanoyl-CoA dioxygenase family protein [Burkholderiaceae bacterium]
MKLTQAQLDAFEREGYLFFPSLFSREEMKVLHDEVPRIYREFRPEIIREKDGVTPRTAFASHTYSEVFARLGRHPRMVEPVSQIFGEDVYMHQFKINGKQAFDGDVWQWHQDYGTWQRDDGMPQARAMNVAIFLDDVTEFNGPLWFIPGSHRDGVVAAGHDLGTTSYPLWTLDNDKVAELVAAGGIVAPKGPAGSMMIFHGCLVHGSPSNMSPWNRVIIYLSLCAVSNHSTKFKRPPYIAHRTFTPIDCLPDDCLLRDDLAGLPWPGNETDAAAMRAEGLELWDADTARAADRAETIAAQEVSR